LIIHITGYHVIHKGEDNEKNTDYYFIPDIDSRMHRQIKVAVVQNMYVMFKQIVFQMKLTNGWLQIQENKK
jgi:predicted GTPase